VSLEYFAREHFVTLIFYNGFTCLFYQRRKLRKCRSYAKRSVTQVKSLIHVSLRRIVCTDGTTIKWHVASIEYGEAYFSTLMQSQTKDWVTEGARRNPFPRFYLELAASGDEASPKNASVGPSNEHSRYPP